MSSSERYDLHVHSNASDGMLAPREVIALAIDRGLAGIALTDHDTVAGIEQASATAGLLGLDLVVGVELSCVGDATREDVHLLGYFVDPAHPDLVRLLTELGRQRHERAIAIVDRLQRLGGAITMEQVLSQSNGRPPGRPHIARAMQSLGMVGSTAEAFSSRWIGDGGKAYVRCAGISVAQGIDAIHGAGGAVAFAHPGIRMQDPALRSQTVRDAVTAGLDAIEVDHPEHREAALERFGQIANEAGLVHVGGSDDHATPPEGPRLGCRTVSRRVVEQLRARIQRPPIDA